MTHLCQLHAHATLYIRLCLHPSVYVLGHTDRLSPCPVYADLSRPWLQRSRQPVQNPKCSLGHGNHANGGVLTMKGLHMGIKRESSLRIALKHFQILSRLQVPKWACMRLPSMCHASMSMKALRVSSSSDAEDPAALYKAWEACCKALHSLGGYKNPVVT